MTQTHAKIKTRKVFYIPGYDPIHPRRYRELYRKEGTEQARISGYSISLSPKTSKGRYGWNVIGNIDGDQVTAEFEVLVWSDIVKSSMDLNIPQTYLVLARTAWTYIASGALRRLMWLRKGPVIAALYPIGMLVLQLIIAILVAWGIGSFVAELVLQVVDWVMVSTAVGWGIALSLMVFILRWFRKVDNKLFAYYLMHDYAYSARSKGANPPELEARMAEFSDEITAALKGGYDEVLVVGHSSGAHLGVSILSDVIRADRGITNSAQLAFLSLGQVVPMVSFLPKAHRLRNDLQFLSMSDDLIWVDVTAPGDGCSFALCDPVAVSGVAPINKKWPLVFSAAFTQSLSPNRWAELRWRFFRLHFQYMCAFDQPKDYDYFKITAGAESMMTRYADRAPSKSRIDVAASPFTSVKP